MKKLVLACGFLLLAGCGHREETIKAIENEYSVLDYETLKMEQDLLNQMVEEQERSLSKMNMASIAIGAFAMALTGSGSIQTAGSQQLDEDKLRLEALTNLLDEHEQAASIAAAEASVQ